MDNPFCVISSNQLHNPNRQKMFQKKMEKLLHKIRNSYTFAVAKEMAG